jgi:lysophospholipase L1-like esterase
MRSARNYPHLLAADLALDLVDVSYSGATTAHVLSEPQHGTPPQVESLDGTEAVVTVTIGGNDIAYVPGLIVASLPSLLRALPLVGGGMRNALDPEAREGALLQVADSLRAVGTTVRERSPAARVLFVEYLTLLPPPGEPAPPLRAAHADLSRHLAARLVEITAEAAAEIGCEVVPVAELSRDHHAWSDDPWTAGATLPFPGRPLAYHPNAAGMRAVATMVREQLGDQPA